MALELPISFGPKAWLEHIFLNHTKTLYLGIQSFLGRHPGNFSSRTKGHLGIKSPPWVSLVPVVFPQFLCSCCLLQLLRLTRCSLSLPFLSPHQLEKVCDSHWHTCSQVGLAEKVGLYPRRAFLCSSMKSCHLFLPQGRRQPPTLLLKKKNSPPYRHLH